MSFGGATMRQCNSVRIVLGMLAAIGFLASSTGRADLGGGSRCGSRLRVIDVLRRSDHAPMQLSQNCPWYVGRDRVPRLVHRSRRSRRRLALRLALTCD